MLKKPINVLLPVLLIFLFAQCTPSKQPIAAAATAPAPEKFPETWVGEWHGTLDIFNGKGKAQSVPMGLHIAPTDSAHRYKMTMIYGEGEKADIRPYEWVAVDAENGYFQTDEKNSIILDDYYLGGVLYSRFEVMGSLLLTRMEKRGEVLYFEIVMGNLEPRRKTGDTGEGEEAIPPVNTYALKIAQRAELRRKS